MNSQVGSGALPADRLPSFGLCLRHHAPSTLVSIGSRPCCVHCRVPVIGRLADKALWLDLRCLEVRDEAEFQAQWSTLGR
jgi:L-seryl-tRNA(Ser) seleniumtransferase